MPTRFHRVQVRRVGREIFELEPIGIRILEMCCRHVVSREVIPQHNHLITIKMMMLGEVKNKVLEPRCTLEDREAKFEEMTMWRSRDEADACVIVSASSFKENGCLADRRPGVGAIRNERESAFVLKNKRQTVFVRFF